MRGVLSSDVGNRLPRLEDGVGVGVEVEMALLLVRAAPRHHEHLVSPAHEKLDEASLWRQVEDVVLVDRWWHDEQRGLVHLGGLRLVLKEFEHIRPQHDRTLGCGQVAADIEAVRVDHGRPAPHGDVAHYLPCAFHEVCATAIDGLLQHGRIGEGEVRRGERVNHVSEREADQAFRPPVKFRVADQPVHGPVQREVALHEAPVKPALGPGPIRETTIAHRRSQGRGAGPDACQFGAEFDDPPADSVRPARQTGA
jgi:hypothetical protein